MHLSKYLCHWTRCSTDLQRCPYHSYCRCSTDSAAMSVSFVEMSEVLESIFDAFVEISVSFDEMSDVLESIFDAFVEISVSLDEMFD